MRVQSSHPEVLHVQFPDTGMACRLVTPNCPVSTTDLPTQFDQLSNGGLRFLKLRAFGDRLVNLAGDRGDLGQPKDGSPALQIMGHPSQGSHESNATLRTAQFIPPTQKGCDRSADHHRRAWFDAGSLSSVLA